MKRKARIIIGAGLAMLAALLLAGCEPSDWDRILAPPLPVQLDSAVPGALGTVTFRYTLPDLSEQIDFFPNYSFGVDYYVRQAESSRETYISHRTFNNSDSGTLQNHDEVFSGLSAGIQYVFIVYTIDTECQRSVGRETGTITW